MGGGEEKHSERMHRLLGREEKPCQPGEGPGGRRGGGDAQRDKKRVTDSSNLVTERGSNQEENCLGS